MGSGPILHREWKQTQDFSIMRLFTFPPKQKESCRSGSKDPWQGSPAGDRLDHRGEAYSGSSRVWEVRSCGGCDLGWVKRPWNVDNPQRQDSWSWWHPHDSSGGGDPFSQVICVGKCARKACTLCELKGCWAILKSHGRNHESLSILSFPRGGQRSGPFLTVTWTLISSRAPRIPSLKNQEGRNRKLTEFRILQQKMFREAKPFFCDRGKQIELLDVLSTSVSGCRAFPENVSLPYSQPYPPCPNPSFNGHSRACPSPSSHTPSPPSLPLELLAI